MGKKARCVKGVRKTKFKVGDVVEVITGDSKGSSGEVLKIDRLRETVLVKEVNLRKRHYKARREGEQAGIISIEAPIHLSNVRVLQKN